MDAAEIAKLVKSPMFREMMGDQADEIAKSVDDPAIAQKMAGFWRQLDNMSASDPKGYDEFIKKQKAEWEAEDKAKKAEREKQRIIACEVICCIKILVAKVLEPKKKADLSETIKLFDSGPEEINASLLHNEQTGAALDQPKIYLNVVHHEKVLPPMKADKTFAPKDDDKEWHLIPISFGANKERWSGAGMKCIHVDAHVNTCVFHMFKRGAAKIGALTNYIIERFQHLLREHYVFHKKSIKIVKGKKYKAWRGANDIVPDYVLPEGYHIDHYEKVQKKIKDKMENLRKQMGLPDEQEAPKEKKDVVMPTAGAKSAF